MDVDEEREGAPTASIDGVDAAPQAGDVPESCFFRCFFLEYAVPRRSVIFPQQSLLAATHIVESGEGVTSAADDGDDIRRREGRDEGDSFCLVLFHNAFQRASGVLCCSGGVGNLIHQVCFGLTACSGGVYSRYTTRLARHLRCGLDWWVRDRLSAVHNCGRYLSACQSSLLLHVSESPYHSLHTVGRQI